LGNYIGIWFLSDGVNRVDDYYGPGRHIAFQEIGAFSTVNIGPYSEVSFDEVSVNEAELVV
jgi:hypothetical protein